MDEIGTKNPNTGKPLVLLKDVAEKLVGRELPDDVFQFSPWGHRLLVVREEPTGTYKGRIIIPESSLIPDATGWVVSVGDLVGQGRVDYVGYCPYPRENLLGRKVVFGQYNGHAMAFGGANHNQYESMFLLMTEGDILGEDCGGKDDK